jgi:uncharacterized protein (TIGR00106 family)
MIIAEVSITPLDKGINVGKYVKEAVKVLEKSELKIQVGAMSTTLEAPDIETLFKVITEAEKAVIDLGSKRVIVNVKIDDRRDKIVTIESKINAVR